MTKQRMVEVSGDDLQALFDSYDIDTPFVYGTLPPFLVDADQLRAWREKREREAQS